MYLLDTNVVSELRRPRPDPAVVAWLRNAPDASIHLPAVVLGELQRGVEQLRPGDPQKAAVIEAWVDQVAGSFEVVPMSGAIFREWARLVEKHRGDLVVDAMIAATARVLGLTVISRNVKHFERLGARIFSPFSSRNAPR